MPRHVPWPKSGLKDYANSAFISLPNDYGVTGRLGELDPRSNALNFY